jgi:hypothetical protein
MTGLICGDDSVCLLGRSWDPLVSAARRTMETTCCRGSTIFRSSVRTGNTGRGYFGFRYRTIPSTLLLGDGDSVRRRQPNYCRAGIASVGKRGPRIVRRCRAGVCLGGSFRVNRVLRRGCFTNDSVVQLRGGCALRFPTHFEFPAPYALGLQSRLRFRVGTRPS